MKRYQIVLCALAIIASAAAFWCVSFWVYRQVLAIALFLIFVALIALSL